MPDRSKVIFGNEISRSAVKKAENSKKKYMKKYGDDSNKNYPAKLVPNACLNKPLGVYDIRVSEGKGDIPFDNERVLLWATSEWASVITVSLSPWRRPLIRLAILLIGWI